MSPAMTSFSICGLVSGRLLHILTGNREGNMAVPSSAQKRAATLNDDGIVIDDFSIGKDVYESKFEGFGINFLYML